MTTNYLRLLTNTCLRLKPSRAFSLIFVLLLIPLASFGQTLEDEISSRNEATRTNGQEKATACTAYSLTNVSATDACEVTKTATVTLSNTTTANLPLGSYTVSYTVNSVSLTASMTVTTAGRGSFSADVSSISPGSSASIAINKLESGACSSAVNNSSNAIYRYSNLLSPSDLNSYDSGSCNSATVQWSTNGNDALTNYYIDVSTVSDFSSFFTTYNNKNLGTVNSHTITGLSNGTTYYYRLRAANYCGTSASVSSSFKVGTVGGTTSANQSICASETPTDISLTGYQGEIQWQISTNNSTYTNITGATTNTLRTASMGPTTTTRYYQALLTYGSCGTKNSTYSRIISYATPTIAAAGADQSNCNSNIFTLTANDPAVGIGAWSIVSGTATIANTSLRNSGVREIPPGTSATLRWTISNGTCPPSIDDIHLTNYAEGTIADAGPPQSNCNVATFTLAGNQPTLGTGAWTQIDGIGSITTPNSSNSGVTGVIAGYNAKLRWTITNGACSSSKDIIIHNYATPTTATAGPDQSKCTTFTLAANDPATNSGTGIWSLVNGIATITNTSSRTSTVTGIPAETSATLRWTISNESCTPSYDDVVLYNSSPAAKAGADQTHCNTPTFTLTANQPSQGPGAWSLLSGTATITAAGQYNSTVTGVAAGSSATLRWTLYNGSCTLSSDDLILTNYTPPTVAVSGSSQTNCNNSNFTMGANSVAAGETGLWSLISGAATITNPSSPSSAVNVEKGISATLRWTITKTIGGCSSSKELVLTNNTTADPSTEEQSFCLGATISNLQAAGTAIQWYLTPTGGTALDATTAVSTANYYASQTLNSCESSRTPVLVSVYNKTWLGRSSSAWNTAANWSPASVPTIKDCVVIPGGTIYKTIVESGDNALAYSLLLQNGGDLSIASAFAITVIDKVTVDTGGKFLLNDSANLIQTNNVANSGTINIIRITKPMYRYDYTYWSSPIADFSLGDLSPDTSSSYYMSWTPTIERGSGWGSGNWHIETANSPMLPAIGYAVRAPQTYSTNQASKTPYTATFVGVPNNGIIKINILKGANANFGTKPGGTTLVANEDDEWNLIGNPYPSGLDAVKFVDDNTDVLNGTIYLWTHNSPPAQINPDPFYGDFVYNYAGADYATFNKTGFVGTESTSIKSTDFNIAAGQSFFVKALTLLDLDYETKASSKIATFTNAMRIGSTNARFYKQVAESKSSSIEKNRLWLNLTNGIGAFSQTLVGYIQGATRGIDRDFDGQSFGGNFVSFYSVRPEMNLTIQGRPLPFDCTDQVALGYKATIQGSFSIRIDHLDGFFENQNTYLEDKLTNILHDLKASPYIFETEIGTFNDRFVLRYNTNTLANSDFDKNNSLTAFIADTKLQITASQEIENLEIYELSGKLIQTQKVIKSREFRSAFPFVKGIYIAKIKLGNGIIVSKKLMN